MALGPDRRYMTRSQADAAQIDVGLRSYMLRVYNYMSLGVAFTAALSMIVAMDVGLVQTISSMFWVFFIGIIGFGFIGPRLMMTKSVGVAQICFWAYAALWGLALGPIIFRFAQIDPMLIAQAFFITAGTFAGMSLLGYTTKKNLSAFGTFFAMATIGLLIAIVVNAIFFQSVGGSLVISMLVVLVFAGITAWETQEIKQMYYEGDGHDIATRKSIFGAFILYGSFVTLFIHILNILGIMRGE